MRRARAFARLGLMLKRASPTGPSPAGTKPSPMMAQFHAIKAQYSGALLFYRMGDFYELFFEDAEIAAKALGIVLTKRGKHEGQDIPMCGVPVERAEDYLHRLIAQGHKVAVCEQVEDPAEVKKRGGKSVVRREVVRLVTPGTITEELLLDPVKANSLVAVARGAQPDSSFGLASIDISTGVFLVAETAEASLEAEIARLEPAEIVAPEALCALPCLSRLARERRLPLTPLGREASEGQSAERRLKDYFGLASLEGLGTLSGAEIAAASAAIFYIERTQFSARPTLNLPLRIAHGARMEIDAATRANLELTRTLAGARQGSLLATIDKTITAAGSRLLGERLAAPLTDPQEISRRLDCVAFFTEEQGLRKSLRTCLKAAPDMIRALSRLALNRGGPRDLAALRDGLATSADMARMLSKAQDLPDDIASARANAAGVDVELSTRLNRALAETLPLSRRDGGFICPGYDPPLDALRALRDESREVIAALQARYSDLLGTRQIKLKHNHFLGYFLEVPQSQGERLLKPPHDMLFTHRQTMAGAMRFSTKELAELEVKIDSAAEEALAREQAIYDELAAMILSREAALKRAAGALASLDVAAALAELAAGLEWARPQVDHSLAFAIESGRHPVVEVALHAEGLPFTRNDCVLSGSLGKGGRIGLDVGVGVEL
ncbi:MAG: DNA mismatch repair protein MutS, partial [Beijerinckiaceae bacterium]|nr:DNA mismatch repair protein MutS [Beijerinckiaceae bacterium]